MQREVLTLRDDQACETWLADEYSRSIEIGVTHLDVILASHSRTVRTISEDSSFHITIKLVELVTVSIFRSCQWKMVVGLTA